MSQAIPKGKKKDISLGRILLRLLPIAFKAAPGLFLWTNLLSVMHGASWGANTWISQLFFDSISRSIQGHAGIGPVLGMAAALGGIAIGTQVLNGLHNFMSEVYFQKAGGYLFMKINGKASRIDPISYEDPAILDDINKAAEGAKNSIILLFIAITIFTFYFPYFLFMGVYLYKLKPVLALSLVLVFAPIALTQLIRSRVFAHLEDQAAPIRREYEYYERCMGDREYFKETRMLGAFRYFQDLYRSTLAALSRKVWQAERKTGLLELGMRMFTLAGYFGVLYLLFVALLSGEITIGAFGAVFASIGAMFSIMEEIVCRHIGQMTQNLGTVRNYFRFLALPERRGKELPVDAGRGIRVKAASFRYPGAECDSLSKISLEIKEGETIAIVGENGAGKTSLVKLLIGLYLPTEGKVEIGGVDSREISPSSIYRGISAVFQKYQRYKMTLDDNIRISDVKAGEKGDDVRRELAAAVEKADLKTEEDSFPNGYDTMLSREFDGVDLSGGQWQRVAIARGFYRAHGLIVLDEPTAAIDPIEETRIYQKFAEISRGKTSIIVTHRLGSARIADRIVVMDRGKIVDMGTHEELMAREGKYREMYRAQAQWYVV